MRLLLGLLVILMNMAAWAAMPRDVFIFNATDSVGSFSVKGYACEESNSCSIAVGRFIQISEQTLRRLCPTERNCEMYLSVEAQPAVVSIMSYNFNEGILFATQSRFVKYRAEKIADDAVRLFMAP